MIIFAQSRHFFLPLFVLSILLMAGCSTTRNVWDSTTEVYDTYVDPKPEIDLDRGPGLSRKEQVLAVQFSQLDQPLEQALRTLAPQDRFPSEEWMSNFQTRFPWMTAIMAVNTQGEMLAQHPQISLKPIDTTPLLAHEWSMFERGLQGFVQDTPLGPEVIIAGPFFRDGNWQGLLVAHFDPRRLVEFSTNPDQLTLLTADELLWSGVNPEVTQEIRDAPWSQILRSDIQGQRSTQSGAYAWMARPIGALHLIYVVALPQ